MKKDFALAWLKVNVDSIFDTLHTTKGSSQDADVLSEAFLADFHADDSEETFKKRVENHYGLQNLNAADDELKNTYRTNLSDQQLKEWGKCIELKSGLGGLLLNAIPDAGKRSEIVLTVLWHRPQTSEGKATLNLLVEGGTLIGQVLGRDRKYHVALARGGETSYSVVPSKGNKRYITIHGEIGGVADHIRLPLSQTIHAAKPILSPDCTSVTRNGSKYCAVCSGKTDGSYLESNVRTPAAICSGMDPGKKVFAVYDISNLHVDSRGYDSNDRFRALDLWICVFSSASSLPCAKKPGDEYWRDHSRGPGARDGNKDYFSAAEFAASGFPSGITASSQPFEIPDGIASFTLVAHCQVDNGIESHRENSVCVSDASQSHSILWKICEEGRQCTLP